MSWDPVRQYGEAVSGDFTDWHPAAMQWLWRHLLAVAPGPGPMLVLQLGLYWGGLTLIAGAARGRSRVGWAVLTCGLLPLGLALTGMIFKDCLMAGVLLVATGLLARRQHGAGPVVAPVGVALLVAAATLRFNAFTAGVPLLVAFLPATWSRRRLMLAAVAATLALAAATPVANRLVGAKPSGVGLSLVIFDLGGITAHAGVDAFPAALDVPGAVAANRACYDPVRWDSYSDWVDPECPLGFTAWRETVEPANGPYAVWMRAIVAHPFAYAAHRLTHFAINTRLLPLAVARERPVPDRSVPNDWGFHITPNALTRTLDTLAVETADTPLGWPIVWIGVALGALLASGGLAGGRLVTAVASSSLLYGLGYVMFSVASELRYHLWTELAALLAVVLVLGDAEVRYDRRLAWCFAPALVALVAGVAARVAG